MSSLVTCKEIPSKISAFFPFLEFWSFFWDCWISFWKEQKNNNGIGSINRGKSDGDGIISIIQYLRYLSKNRSSLSSISYSTYKQQRKKISNFIQWIGGKKKLTEKHCYNFSSYENEIIFNVADNADKGNLGLDSAHWLNSFEPLR